jgi:AcrR family transcriptional regulator
MSATKQRLIDGALRAVREHGIAGVSARTIAAAAGVNQALVFYHFGSVDDLLAAACREATQARVAVYAGRFESVASLRELLDLGREVHAEEHKLGNVSVLAQMLAGAQSDPRLAGATADSLRMWTVQVETVLARLLKDTPVSEIADVTGLATAISAAFVGLELYQAADPAGAQHALTAIEQLAVLLEVVDDLGPVARRALRAKLSTKASKATKAGKIGKATKATKAGKIGKAPRPA